VAATSHFSPHIAVHLGQHFIYLQSLSVFFNHDFTWSWARSSGSSPFYLQNATEKEIRNSKTNKKESRDFCNKEIERRARNISNGPRQAESFDWKMFKGYEVSTDELSLGCPLFLCLDSCLFHFSLFAVCCQCCQVKIRGSRQRFLREMYTEEISSKGNLICCSSSDTFPMV